ncbi:endonuclease VII [Streptomyces sp. CL12-4]|uniref:endonuclease VII n=1 Tax=Streptomyces sp. CL12-4 TaxID=2810306 RepID=UPI001EFB55A9|nr:endonuclease VII [Streptomyces sp. CL12-4]MCG8971570.1 endonuclease VII [Streptomyces sp. CL12-4]
MPISREYARSLFADLTQSAAVPLDPDELLHMPGLRQHGHVFFGDRAVRCYKHKGRWTYAEREIREAGGALAELDVDLDDVVDVQLPAHRNAPEGVPGQWLRLDWRSRLVSWMFDRAREQRYEQGRHCSEWGSWRKIGANGLPGEPAGAF